LTGTINNLFSESNNYKSNTITCTPWFKLVLGSDLVSRNSSRIIFMTSRKDSSNITSNTTPKHGTTDKKRMRMTCTGHFYSFYWSGLHCHQ